MYAKEFFLLKFIGYAIFLTFYYVDIETLLYQLSNGGTREKGIMFYSIKIVCSMIQLLFFNYEIM